MNVYINSFRASEKDIALLLDRCREGTESIEDVHITKQGNLAFVTT